MRRGDPAQVRRRAYSLPGESTLPVVSIQLRADVFCSLETLDWSLIAWYNPGASILANYVVERVELDGLLVAEADMFGECCKIFDRAVALTDPFPERPERRWQRPGTHLG